LEASVPILVRPVREQLEHDRIIRLLEAKWRRKFKVDANPGDERNAGVKVPAGTFYPDLVLTEEGGRKPKALIEVETSESVNHLEAMAQWAHLAKARTSLLLFVPAGAVESARRLASENSIKVAELWTYLVLGDQVRFTSVFRENGTEPADLVEKVEVFTTERSAPQPRPVVVEPVAPEPVPEPAAAERPRKLAVKIGSRAPSELAAAKAKAALAPPASAAKAAPVAAKPVKVEPPKAAVAPPVKAAPPKAPEKKVAPPKPAAKAAPVKAAPAKPAPAPAKPAAKVAVKKAAPPPKAAKKPAPKPVKAAAAKAAKKPAPAKASSSRTAKRK
jgi:hypothetical protein